MTLPDYPTLHSSTRLKFLYEAHGLQPTIGRPLSGWTQGTVAGATPTTAQACGRTLTGAMTPPAPVAPATSRLVEVVFGSTSGGFYRVAGTVADRLSHQGGLVGNSTSTQTTNLPTAALTRYTSGEGVWIALEIYLALGSTQTTATISYTNQAGTAGRTGTCQLGGTGTYQALSQMVFVALQAGDTGARSVESVTLTASTGIAGNFGVTLFRPLSFFVGQPGMMKTHVWINSFGGCMALPPIEADACLMPIFYVPSASNGVRAEFSFVEG